MWFNLFGFMPSFEQLENPKSNIASQVISSDGVVLGTFYIQNRTNTHFEELSPNVVNALLATEDARFFKHSGIDFRGLFRVIVKNIILRNKNAGGGSTITQQLAKNLFPRNKDMNFIELIVIKMKEWLTAVKLEKSYTKQEIIAMYLNTVDFGSQAYGIKSAAKTFFDKEPSDLTIDESALLIGLLKAPTYFSPVRNPENSIKRRNVVLNQMRKYNYIDDKTYEQLIKKPIDMSKYKMLDQNTGPATYFREILRERMMQWCQNHKKQDGSNYDLYRDGLKIYVTINSRMQQYAEEAVTEYMGKELQPLFFKHWKGIKNAPFNKELDEEKINEIIEQAKRRSDRYIILKKDAISEDKINEIFNTPVKMKIFTWNGEKDTIMTPIDSIKYYKYFLQAGLMSVDVTTGNILAYVGGINFKYFKYDHVIKGKRQVGSTFKPFLYTLAMQEGEFTPCSKVPNIPVSFNLDDGTVWTPKNADDIREGQMVTLKWALANSVNYISAYLIKRYSPSAVVSIVRKMGITSPIEPVYSICLGTPDLSLYEMVGAYNCFANKGQYVEPSYILRIEDRYGHVLEHFYPKRNEVISEETSYLMISLMKGVVESGTGIGLRYKYNFDNEIAGKTGTTQNHSDGWFMGIVPQMVTGVWVGGDDRSIHFRSLELGQGARMALPIWALYMKKIYNDKKLNIKKDAKFEKPKNFSINLDCNEIEQEVTKKKNKKKVIHNFDN